MSKPIIGITAGRHNLRPPKDELQTSLVGCPIEYLTCIESAGGAPVLLPRTDDVDVIARVVAGIDGLLLSGGGDIVSLAYGQEPHPKAIQQDPVRDSMELTATRLAIEAGMPILGICRGVQLLNVAMGGTLVQDIASQLPDTVQHHTKERETFLVHTIDIEADSLLARVLGARSTAVNSWHHQAVGDLGDGLRVAARARDGVIEALEATDGQCILAVQCHPEDSADKYPLFQKLFDWLVAESRKMAAG
ncbi:MAG: gamma-glutamyl-gamma-aminobutyrate hydrolase family protein [Planctomycetota bacterium]|jgi:putative glutamine amidotransferase